MRRKVAGVYGMSNGSSGRHPVDAHAVDQLGARAWA